MIIMQQIFEIMIGNAVIYEGDEYEICKRDKFLMSWH